MFVKLTKTKKTGRIVGWCPDKKGRPRAMILLKDKIICRYLNEFKVTKYEGNSDK